MSRLRRCLAPPNVDELLATLERLYAAVAEADGLGAIEFLDRMSWLTPLLPDLEQSQSLDCDCESDLRWRQKN